MTDQKTKLYCYNKRLYEDGALISVDKVCRSGGDILKEDWERWTKFMTKYYNAGSDTITEEHFFADWLNSTGGWTEDAP